MLEAHAFGLLRSCPRLAASQEHNRNAASSEEIRWIRRKFPPHTSHAAARCVSIPPKTSIVCTRRVCRQIESSVTYIRTGLRSSARWRRIRRVSLTTEAAAEPRVLASIFLKTFPTQAIGATHFHARGVSFLCVIGLGPRPEIRHERSRQRKAVKRSFRVSH